MLTEKKETGMKQISLILIFILIVTTTGCSQVDGNALKSDTNLIVDMTKEKEQGGPLSRKRTP